VFSLRLRFEEGSALVNESFGSRGLSITLSCLLHLGLAMGLILDQQWTAVRPVSLPEAR